MLRKVVVIGPESTGKSTLSQQLAEHLSCPFVPEYARNYLDSLDRDYAYADLLSIAKGQVENEDQLAKESSDWLICDTDLQVIKVWSLHKFGKVDPWIEREISTRKYDLYLLCDIDIPWQHDPQREHPEPEMRKYFFDWFQRIVSESGVPFVLISGGQKERLTKAVGALNKIKGLE